MRCHTGPAVFAWVRRAQPRSGVSDLQLENSISSVQSLATKWYIFSVPTLNFMKMCAMRAASLITNINAQGANSIGEVHQDAGKCLILEDPMWRSPWRFLPGFVAQGFVLTTSTFRSISCVFSWGLQFPNQQRCGSSGTQPVPGETHHLLLPTVWSTIDEWAAPGGVHTTKNFRGPKTACS